MLRKAELKDKCAAIRKALDKQTKEKEAAANKKALEDFATFVKENPEAVAYVALVEADGNAKLLQAVAAAAKKADKAIYVFSKDEEAGKVAHVNYVTPALKAKGADARKWAEKVTDLISGKAGGKEDSAQGVGTELSKVEEALAAAREYIQGL